MSDTTRPHVLVHLEQIRCSNAITLWFIDSKIHFTVPFFLSVRIPNPYINTPEYNLGKFRPPDPPTQSVWKEDWINDHLFRTTLGCWEGRAAEYLNSSLEWRDDADAAEMEVEMERVMELCCAWRCWWREDGDPFLMGKEYCLS